MLAAAVRSPLRSSVSSHQVLSSYKEAISRQALHLRAPNKPFRSLNTSAARHAEQFQPFAPPPPSSLPRPGKPKEHRRLRKWTRRAAYLLAFSAAAYGADRAFNASALTRSVRTFRVAVFVAADYKINFRPKPWFGGTIEELHARSARRVFELLRENGGLYLKMGQAIAMQSAVLPEEFKKMFSRMFDDAPQCTWAEVEKVIREDFGKSVDEVFGVVAPTEDQVRRGGWEKEGLGAIERRARASASVAQVHWAKLKDGREVAIKIQKPEIAKQVGWDLWAFKVVMWVQSRLFDIPFYTLVPYITERIMLETDFENEAKNSEQMADLVANEPRLRNRVYIPRVYHDLSTKRVMTAEWIEGVRLWDKDSLTRTWQGGWRQGSPGCSGAPLDDPNPPKVRNEQLDAYLANNSASGKNRESGWIKPERDWWRGPLRRGGLGLSLSDVMTTMVDLFSAQMFLWGVVHCDPHPGNIFIRRRSSGQPQLVLVDHGLYITMSPTFRHQYATFWKSLLTFDNASLRRIAGEWGIRNADFFASATLMRPYEGGDKSFSKGLAKLSESGDSRERAYAAQQQMRQALRDMLGDETKWPRQLVFLGRNLRIVQANNQYLGSPVNRIKIAGTWASRALVDSPDLPWRERMGNLARHVVFRVVMLGSDVAWWLARFRQLAGWGGGLEDEIEERMKVMAKDMGVELNHGVFDG